MVKPELGSKRVCVSCSARFYDLTKSPAVCPKCGTEQPVEQPKPKRGGGNAVEEKRPKKVAVPRLIVTPCTCMPAASRGTGALCCSPGLRAPASPTLRCG